ncbi:hypothetical protein QCA50_005673 [Cerrena zonata]|uniref:F-box domain-containing protein n=1 Tax=Cerrena zonata TaxID=2478898 RepID=A0AAW0GHA4_9APHY
MRLMAAHSGTVAQMLSDEPQAHDNDMAQAVAADHNRSEYPIANRVHPIALRLIFETAFPPTEFRDPSLSLGPRSAWSQALRTQKALTAVCQSWRAVALMFLYQDVVLRRVGQIPALVRTLRSNKEGIEDHIKSLTFACFVPEPWDDVVSRNIEYLIDRCSNLRALTFWGPFVDWLQTSNSNGRVFDPLKTFKRHTNNITRLSYFDLLQSTTPVLDIVPGPLLTAFPNLTHLSLASHSSPSESYNPATPDPSLLNLSFPYLTHLELLPKNGPIAMAFFYILHTWSLPSLTHLRMDLSLQWHNCTSYDHHIAFVNKFGPQLKFVNFGGNFSVHASAFEGPTGEGTPMPVKGFVKSCTSVSKVGHMVMALWDVDGVSNLSWILEDDFEGWLDLWVPSKDFVLLKEVDPFADLWTSDCATTSHIYTHTLSSKYNRPNIRLLDQALAHMPNLPLLYPPGSIAENDTNAYVHRVNGLRFIQTRRMIVQHEMSWTEERPVWEVDDRDSEEGDTEDEEEGGQGMDGSNETNVHNLQLLPFSSQDAFKYEGPSELSHIAGFSALPFSSNIEDAASEADATESSVESLNDTEEDTVYESTPGFEKVIDFDNSLAPAQQDALLAFQPTLPFDTHSTPSPISSVPIILYDSCPCMNDTALENIDELLSSGCISSTNANVLPQEQLHHAEGHVSQSDLSTDTIGEYFVALPLSSRSDIIDDASPCEQVPDDSLSLHLLQDALPFYHSSEPSTPLPLSLTCDNHLLLFKEALPFTYDEEVQNEKELTDHVQQVVDDFYEEDRVEEAAIAPIIPQTPDVDDPALIPVDAAVNEQLPQPQDPQSSVPPQVIQDNDDDDSTYNPVSDSYEYTDSYYTDSDLDWDSDDELFVRPKLEENNSTASPYELFEGVADLFADPFETGNAPADVTAEASSSSTQDTAKRPKSYFERQGDIPQLSEEEALAIFELWNGD